MGARRHVLVLGSILALGVIFGAQACAMDFDKFEAQEGTDGGPPPTGSDGSTPVDGASSDAKPATEGGADSGDRCQNCENTFEACRGACETTREQCRSACGGGSSGNNCREACDDKRDDCRDKCGDDCRNCAGQGCGFGTCR